MTIVRYKQNKVYTIVNVGYFLKQDKYFSLAYLISKKWKKEERRRRKRKKEERGRKKK